MGVTAAPSARAINCAPRQMPSSGLPLLAQNDDEIERSGIDRRQVLQGGIDIKYFEAALASSGSKVPRSSKWTWRMARAVFMRKFP